MNAENMAEVTRLDREIGVLEEQPKNIQAKLPALKAKRNGLLGVLQLPAELFCKIFMELKKRSALCCFDHGKWYNCKKWMSVTYICRQWRQYAIDYAPLWSDICFSVMSPLWIEASISRSKQVPLSIHHGSMADSVHPMLPNILLEHTHRLSGLDLEFRVNLGGLFSDDSDLQAMRPPGLLNPIRSSAPILQYLSIRSGITITLPQQFLNGGGTTQLHSLRLEGCYLPWTSQLFQEQLTTLHIDFYLFPEYLERTYPNLPRHRGRLIDIVSAVANAPRLKYLHLGIPPEIVDTSFGFDQNHNWNTRPLPVAFPFLKDLDLRSSCVICAVILGSMYLPPQARLDIRCWEPNDTSIQALSSSMSSAWSSLPLLGCPDCHADSIPLHRLEALWDGDDLYLIGSTYSLHPSPNYDATICRVVIDGRRHYGSYPLSLILGLPLRDVDLLVISSVDMGDNWQHVLPLLGSVRKIDFKNVDISPHSLIDALQESPHEGTRMLLPVLESVNYHGVLEDTYQNALAGILERRSPEVGGESSSVQVPT